MKQRGFTLMEAVVALAVLALLAGALLGLVSRLQRDAQALEQAADQTAGLRGLFRIMTRDLAAAVLHPASGAPLTGSAVHYGDHDVDSFALLRKVDHGGQSYPQQRVSYQAIRESDDTVTVVRVDGATQGNEPSPAQSRLVTGLQSFRVRYLASDGQWVSGWPRGGVLAQSGLPKALRVELEESSGAIWHTTFSLPAGGNG
jgi:type II secretion system protein J